MDQTNKHVMSTRFDLVQRGRVLMDRLGNNGYMLIEVLVATTLISMALVAVVARVSDSIAVNRLAVEEATATRLAQEAVEWLRANRSDVGWDDFTASITCASATCAYCWNELPLTGLGVSGACGAGASVWGEGIFGSRTLTLDATNPNQVDYMVEVEWKFGNRDEKVRLEGSLNKGEYE